MLTYFATALLLDFLTSPLSYIPSMTKTADLTPAQISLHPTVAILTHLGGRQHFWQRFGRFLLLRL